MFSAILITVLVAYMLGNLNGAVCISALLHDDVRSHGSGNAGLTNFIRNFGVNYAVRVILIDAGKAVLACVMGGMLLKPYDSFLLGATLGGAAVVLGHDFPALLGFHGGKGILSGLFVALVVDWRIGLLILAVFAVVYLLSGYVSLGSVVAALTFSVGFAVFHSDNLPVMLCGVLIGLVCVYMHRQNIRRLLNGTEKKTNLFKGKE